MKKAFSIEQDVYQMITMAIELWRQGQYQTEETILVQALELAQRIDDLSSIIYIRRLLAYAQIDQWKYLEALDHCTWLISLASDPDYQDLLSWEDKFEIKNGYEAFITCAENLPNMVDEDILSVLNTAIGWLERIGKDEWTIMLRIKKGNIHLKRGETSQAEDAYTKSLALCLRADMPEGVLLCQAQLVQVQQQVTGDYNVFSRWKDLMNDAVKNIF
jgi:tetratricopeptide (TPR) repeat protein